MALFSAAAKGDVLKIQSLIVSEDKSKGSGGVDVNCSDASGKTPLHIASENGHLQTVEWLTHHGAKVNVIDANLQTSVHLCSKIGHLHEIKLLVNEGADIKIGDKDGFTALHIASFEGHLDIVKYLVEKGAQLDKCHLEVVEYILYKGAGIGIGDKALHIASLEGHLDIVKYLVSKGAELERLDNDYWTPLHLALDGGHLDIAEYLLTEGANINTCGKGGYTALHSASKAGNIDRVKYLTSQRAELDKSTDDGWTALSLASFWGHLDIVKVLVNGGVEIDNEPRNGMTPLFLAAERGHLGIVEVLLNVGANIDNCNRDGLTALHIASSNGHVEIVHHLVSKGAQLDKCDKTDKTPLYCASREGHLEVVEYIVNKDAGIEIGDKDGFTALHRASLEGHLEVVVYIVNKGASIGIGDKDGFTVLHIASLNGHLDIVKYLVSKGADPGKLTDDYWTPSRLALNGGHLGIHDFLLNREATKIVKPFIGFEEDHYDYLRSTFGSKAFPGYMPPSSRTYDPYRTSPQDSSRSSRKSSTEETMIISLDEYSIKVTLSPDDVDRAKYITAEALTTIPHDLNLEKDEVIISVGLKLSPPGLQFKTPVEVTVSHSAIFTNPDKAEIVLYTRRTGNAQFDKCDKKGRTPLSCASQKGHLEVVEYIVNKGAGIEIGDKDGVTALYKASFNGHLDIVKYLVSKGADPGKLANEEDHYDYLRSTFGGEALPSFMPHSYSPPYDPYLTSPRDSSSSSRKSITEETKIISLDEYSIKVPISPDDVDKATYITAEALTTIPPDLKLDKDEVIISVGLKLSPPGLQFKTPVEVTVSHSAIFTNPDKAEIVLYTRRTGSDEFSRTVPASDKAARCVVAKNHLTLYLDHFSEWWIISLIKRYFIGKRLVCTPYVPLSTSRDVIDPILLVIKDDCYGMKEDTIQEYKAAYPGEQYCVYWRQGPLLVRHLENEDEVSTQELEVRAFFDMTTNRMPFALQSREKIVSGVLVTLILKQTITKRIAFKVMVTSSGWVSPSPSHGDTEELDGGPVPTEEYNPRGTPFGLPMYRVRIHLPNQLRQNLHRPKAKLNQLMLDGEQRNDTIQDYKVAFPGEQYCVYWGQGPLFVRHLENEDEVSTQELEECAFFHMTTHRMPFSLQPREASEVPVMFILKQKVTKRIAFKVLYNDVPHENPIAQSTPTGSASSKGKTEPTDVGRGTSKSSQLSEEPTRSEHRDLETIVPTSPEPAYTKDGSSPTEILTRPSPLTPPSTKSQLCEHAYQVTHDLVTETGAIVPPMLQHELRCRLNRESPVFDDWRGLANQLGLQDYIQSLEQCKNPTEELLVLAESQKKIQNLGDLAKAFERMNRGDCLELCEKYAFERTKSADPRKVQMEDDDTDISD
eukprot:XP_011666263.1 PREDICTED: ankyrin-1-like [Strongylocentrotus purpuratus]